MIIQKKLLNEMFPWNEILWERFIQKKFLYEWSQEGNPLWDDREGYPEKEIVC